MTPKVCICCGEPMADQANHFSRNPNICASCSSMVDGMEETALPEGGEERTETPPPEPKSPLSSLNYSEKVVVRWSGRHVAEDE